jgi:hypothetical protein
MKLPHKPRHLRVVVGTAVLLVSALVALPALAQDKGASKKKGDKSRTVSFEDDLIEAQYLRPDTEAIQGLSNRTRTSLIRIRKDFFAEIIRSAEDI